MTKTGWFCRDCNVECTVSAGVPDFIGSGDSDRIYTMSPDPCPNCGGYNLEYKGDDDE